MILFENKSSYKHRVDECMILFENVKAPMNIEQDNIEQIQDVNSIIIKSIQMRSMKRLRNTDFKKIQQSIKQKAQKQIQTLSNLMQVPDYDVIQFFQTLMKSQNYEQILSSMPKEKKVEFFSKNYEAFLQTQDELLVLKLPELREIPKAKQFHLKLKQQDRMEENVDQASVIQIIDSFSTHVLQKKTDEVLRIYKIIMEMKEHSKYKEYFYSYPINKIFREAYISFVQNCDDSQVLIRLNQDSQAIKVYFKDKEDQIFQNINTDLKIDSSVHSIRKTLSFLLGQIEESSQQFKVKFSAKLQSQPQLSIYLSKWIQELSRSYYGAVESLIYEQQQISEILKLLSSILETSREIQSKGVSLYRQLRMLISNDLPVHLQKIIEVVLESFDDMLKYNNEMYEFVQFNKLNSIRELVDGLTQVGRRDYGKKCCSQKGILLLNSLLMILLPLCQQKWAFLHENILGTIADKVQGMMQRQRIKLPMWDYYHLFMFFYQLGQGKVKHRTLFECSNAGYLKEKLSKIRKLGEECRCTFENKLMSSFWTQVLSEIPQLLWQFKKYAECYQKSSIKPTTFSIALIFSLQQFFKQIEFRLSKQHYEYLGVQLYEYIIYVLQYVLFWSYHEKGRNDKVFTLYKKQEKFLTKAKQLFIVEELNGIKNNKILKLSNFTKFGLERFVVDVYFVTDVYRVLMNGFQKIKADEFLYKVSRILAKQLKNQPLETQRKNYSQLLKQFTNIYQKQPQLMKKYLNQRKLASSSSSHSHKSSRSK